MFNATGTPTSSSATAAELRVVYHPLLCPECGSTNVVAEDVETGDEVTETALICRACGSAWPVACVCDWLPAFPAARAARQGVTR